MPDREGHAGGQEGGGELTRALEKTGFTAEGITRGIGWRDGQWRDGVTYSLLRTDPAP